MFRADTRANSNTYSLKYAEYAEKVNKNLNLLIILKFINLYGFEETIPTDFISEHVRYAWVIYDVFITYLLVVLVFWNL